MPALGVAKITSSVERDATPCQVVDLSGTGAPFDFAQVLSVKDEKGGLGKAIVRVTNVFSNDESNPITLDPQGYYSRSNLPGYSRVKFMHDGELVFIGNLINRVDKGEPNSIQLSYVNDLVHLTKLPVRGCLVLDPFTFGVIFVPGFEPIMNPKGANNCCKASVPGFPGECWVFTHTGFSNANGEWSDDIGKDPPTGKAVPWTGERALMYWSLFSQFTPVSYHREFVKLDTSKLLFPNPTMTFDSKMKRKLPQVSFKGMRVYGAIQKTLDATGELDMYAYPLGSHSILMFRPKSHLFNALGTTGSDIFVQRGGAVEDIKSVFDFEAETDYLDLCTGVVIEGDRVKIESEYFHDPGSEATSTLIRAWTDAERTAFNLVINGNGTHAKGPLKPEDLNTSKDWVLMDGTGGRPLILVKTPGARNLARGLFPKVLRAFVIAADYRTAGGAAASAKLYGAGSAAGKFSNLAPLSINRRIDDVQLQPFFESDPILNSNQRGRLRWPTRIQVKLAASGQWHDVLYNNGLRPEDDGLIYFDGLTDDIAGDDNIYEGNLTVDPSNVTMREIRLNAYVEHDIRIKAHKDIFWDSSTDPNKIKDELDPSISKKETRLGFQHYVLSEDAYQEEHQYESRPAGSGTVSRILHTDDTQIGAAADRKLKDVAKAKKKSVYWLPGMRTEFRAGDMIGKIIFKGAGQSGSHEINSPLQCVVMDFDEQRTGLIPE